jgi:uncharacterized protein
MLMKRKLLFTFGTFFTVYILLCISLRIWQNRLIFAPKNEIVRTPKDLGLFYEDVWLSIPNKSPEKEVIHGWWIPSRSTYSAKSKVLLSFHGKGGNISTSSLSKAKELQRLGFSIFLVDYRGYGLSRGNFPSEKQVYEDAELAWQYLVKSRQIPTSNIYIYGYSLGGAIAVNLAVNHPEAAALVVESSLTSMRLVATNSAIYRLFPLDLILTEKFDSLTKISQLKVPLLVIHGTADEVIPFQMGKVLFNAAKVPKQIQLFPNGSHAIATKDIHKYLETIKDFYQFVDRQQ